MHRLPRQLGWGLGLLAFVCSLAVDYQRDPAQDQTTMIIHAVMWGGLCAIFAGAAGYLACVAMGGNLPPAPPGPALIELPPAPEPSESGRAGRVLDITAGQGSALPPPVPDMEEEFAAYSPEHVADAVRSQLGAEESRVG